MSDKWYNAIPGVNCVFAMDHDCPVNRDGTIVNYSNNNSKILTVLDGLINKVYKAEFSAYKIKDYIYLLDTVYKYKALRLDNVNLRAPDPIVLPENCTIIFVGKLESTSIFMSAENRNSYGLYMDNANNSYKYTWRVSDSHPNSHHSRTLKNSVRFGTFVDTVAIRGDKFTRSIDYITSYGTMKAVSNTYINQAVPHFPIIGHIDTRYKPDAYIVAYGVFDKQLSDEEINIILEKIDDQFLVESGPSSSITITNFDKYTVDFDILPQIINEGKTKSHKILDGFKSVETKAYVKDINIKEYSEIKDYVYEEEEPVSTKLFLIDRDTGEHISTTFSNIDGYFEFKNVDKNREYLVVAPHLNYQFRAIVKDYLPGNK